MQFRYNDESDVSKYCIDRWLVPHISLCSLQSEQLHNVHTTGIIHTGRELIRNHWHASHFVRNDDKVIYDSCFSKRVYDWLKYLIIVNSTDIYQVWFQPVCWWTSYRDYFHTCHLIYMWMGLVLTIAKMLMYISIIYVFKKKHSILKHK